MSNILYALQMGAFTIALPNKPRLSILIGRGYDNRCTLHGAELPATVNMIGLNVELPSDPTSVAVFPYKQLDVANLQNGIAQFEMVLNVNGRVLAAVSENSENLWVQDASILPPYLGLDTMIEINSNVPIYGKGLEFSVFRAPVLDNLPTVSIDSFAEIKDSQIYKVEFPGNWNDDVLLFPPRVQTLKALYVCRNPTLSKSQCDELIHLTESAISYHSRNIFGVESILDNLNKIVMRDITNYRKQYR